MAKSIESILSFNAGEISPTLTARVDQQKYRSACLQLRNMLAFKTGPATRRPGTEFIAKTKFPYPFNYAVRLQDFQFSVTTTFVLEFGQNYIRFYSNGAQVMVEEAPLWQTLSVYNPGDYVTDPTDGLIYYCIVQWIGGTVEPHADGGAHWIQQNILEVPTPYDATLTGDNLAASEVYQLQFCAINDVVYICHPKHPRYKLTRVTDTHWTMAPVIDSVPALLDQNATDITIASTQTTGPTTLTADAPEWNSGFYYEAGAAVKHAGILYVCLIANVGGAIFEDDLGLGYWKLQKIFQPGHVGSYWELSNLRDSANVEYTGDPTTGFADGTSAPITAFGAWEVHTYGVWSGDILIQSSTDGGITWQTVRSVTGRNDRNVDMQGTAFKAQLYRIVVSNSTPPPAPGPTSPRIVFECVDAFLFGIVQITAVPVIAASAMVNALTYQIVDLADTDWNSLGLLGDPAVGSVFNYNGTAVSGSGTVFNPYIAQANVITQLPVANAWVSDQPYVVGDRVGYAGVNYIALFDVASSTPPASDGANWLADGYPTIYWSEGAWSGVRGYPRSITAFGQRVWCGFTEYEPQRIWATQTGDIENWDLGDQTLATDAVAFDLDAVGDGAILWMNAQDALFIGLVSAEWVITSSDQTGSIGPTSIAAHRQSKWGSNTNIAARVVGDALVFVQRQAFSLRQMLFSVVTNKYMSQDLTTLSEQILNGGAIQLAYQPQGQKNGFLWTTTKNGELVGMTYELDQEIFGWHRHTTGVADQFESVCVIPGKGTDDDEVWVVVRRNIQSAVTQRYVERLNPINWTQNSNATPGQPGYPAFKNSAYYVDSGRTFTNPSTNVFSGFDHLLGKQVSVCINAQDFGLWPVADDGTVTVDDFVPSIISFPPTIANIGLPFTSTLQPMNLDVDVHTGITQGITKGITDLYISFLNTLACKVSDGAGRANSVKELNFRDPQDLLAEPPLFSGVYDVDDFPGDYDLKVPVIMFTDGPLPMTIRGVAIGYALSGTP